MCNTADICIVKRNANEPGSTKKKKAHTYIVFLKDCSRYHGYDA